MSIVVVVVVVVVVNAISSVTVAVRDLVDGSLERSHHWDRTLGARFLNFVLGQAAGGLKAYFQAIFRHPQWPLNTSQIPWACSTSYERS